MSVWMQPTHQVAPSSTRESEHKRKYDDEVAQAPVEGGKISNGDEKRRRSVDVELNAPQAFTSRQIDSFPLPKG